MNNLSVKELFLGEFDRETATARKILERVPSEKWDWTPHAKSAPLGQLAIHVASLLRLASNIVNDDRLTFDGVPPAKITNTAELVATFDTLRAAGHEALAQTTDEHLAGQWELFFGERKVFEGSRALAFQSIFMDHFIHHRAQLGVYLRLNDVAIPGSYGPSADEPMM